MEYQKGAPMDQIKSFEIFRRVAETGSFSKAAKDMQFTQPTVSKAMAALEEQLGVQLILRTTRGVSLSELGQEVYKGSQKLIDSYEQIQLITSTENAEPKGKINLACPVTFGQMHIFPHLDRFLGKYPKIELDIKLSDTAVDLISEGIDCAVRIGDLSDSTLIAKRVGTTRRVVVGTPRYLKKYGIPKCPKDLEDHNCVIFSKLQTGNKWPFISESGRKIGVRVKGNLRVDNSAGARTAVLSGIGLGLFPTWGVGEEINQKQLKVVLKNYEARPMPIHLVYPPGHFIPFRVRILSVFLADEFKKNRWLR